MKLRDSFQLLFVCSALLGYLSVFSKELLLVQSSPLGCHSSSVLSWAPGFCPGATTFSLAFAIFFFSALVSNLTAYRATALLVSAIAFAIYRLSYFSHHVYLGTDYITHSDSIVFITLLLCSIPSSTLPRFERNNLIKTCLALTFLASAVSKLKLGGAGWLNGDAIRYYLTESSLLYSNSIATWFAEQPGLCRLAGWLVLSFESLFALSLYFKRFERIFATIGLLFHGAVYLTLKANFFIGFAAVYWVYACSPPRLQSTDSEKS